MMYTLPMALALLVAPGAGSQGRRSPSLPPTSAMSTAPRAPLMSGARRHDGPAWLWRLSPRALAAPERLEEAQLRPAFARALPRPDGSLLIAQPVPSVVTLERVSGSDGLEEDSCLGWHAQSVANFQRLHLGWLTVDQAAVAALQPGRCNSTMGLDLSRLGAKHP